MSLLDPSGSCRGSVPGQCTVHGLRDGLSRAPSRSGGAASPQGLSLSGRGCPEPHTHWGSEEVCHTARVGRGRTRRDEVAT